MKDNFNFKLKNKKEQKQFQQNPRKTHFCMGDLPDSYVPVLLSLTVSVSESFGFAFSSSPHILDLEPFFLKVNYKSF